MHLHWRLVVPLFVVVDARLFLACWRAPVVMCVAGFAVSAAGRLVAWRTAVKYKPLHLARLNTNPLI